MRVIGPAALDPNSGPVSGTERAQVWAGRQRAQGCAGPTALKFEGATKLVAPELGGARSETRPRHRGRRPQTWGGRSSLQIWIDPHRQPLTICHRFNGIEARQERRAFPFGAGADGYSMKPTGGREANGRRGPGGMRRGPAPDAAHWTNRGKRGGLFAKGKRRTRGESDRLPGMFTTGGRLEGMGQAATALNISWSINIDAIKQRGCSYLEYSTDGGKGAQTVSTLHHHGPAHRGEAITSTARQDRPRGAPPNLCATRPATTIRAGATGRNHWRRRNIRP